MNNQESWLTYIENLSFSIYDWTLLFAIAFLALELLDDVLKRRMSGQHLLETGASLLTQIPFYFSETVIFAGFVYLYFYLWEIVPWQQPLSGWLMVVVIVAADFIYYWEHRAAHRVRLLWAAHSVHHSSPVMNTATAFRFSVFDPVISGLFYLPLVLCGVHPVYVFAGEILVQAYQFWIHNEMIGKLGPLESVLNTPSHHRVHHGSNAQYLDKNYGGILIVWDRLFGTFQREAVLPTYGLTSPIKTTNPIKVQFFEFMCLLRDCRTAKTTRQRLAYLMKPPGWQPTELTHENR